MGEFANGRVRAIRIRVSYWMYLARVLQGGERAICFQEFETDWDYAEWLESSGELDGGVSQGWLCWCGHWQDDGLHCELCGNEPPWGCDCGWCSDVRDYGDYLDEAEWLDSWTDYPAELLTGELEEVGG
jgi:hypothetical protein